MRALTIGSITVMFGVSCLADESTRDRISVRPNELGIASLDVERSTVASNADRMFEIHGLDAGVELASVRYRIGYIDSLSARGTEIEWTAEGQTDRMTTRAIAPRETRVDGKQRAFAMLPEVRGLLERELGLELALPPQAGQAEAAYDTVIDTCGSENLRDDGPFGQGCCRELWNGNTAWVTFHDGNTVVNRFFGGGQNGWSACTMYDGTTNCAGPNNGLGLPACDFGPCGAAAPQQYTASYVHEFQHLDNGPYCGWDDNGPDWNPGGVSGSCPYRTCNNGTPVTGGDGGGYFDD